MSDKLVIPVINLNGNSRQSLIDQALAVHKHLESAKNALAESDLAHGRNYQTVPEMAGAAREQRRRQYEALEQLSREFLTIAYEIQQAYDKAHGDV